MMNNIFPIALSILFVYSFYQKFISKRSGRIQPLIDEMLYEKYRKRLLIKYGEDSTIVNLD